MGTIAMYPLLKAESKLQNNAIGGRFVLPREFDSKKYASAFYAEGNECSSMTEPQPVLGTRYVAPGWKTWLYPKGHTKADKPHKVGSLEKEGQTMVLMYRDIAIQKQVSEAYGEVSRIALVREIRGETISADDGKSGGMISEEKLAKVLGSESGDGTDDPGSAVVKPTRPTKLKEV